MVRSLVRYGKLFTGASFGAVPLEDQCKTVRDYVINNREWNWNCFAPYLPGGTILSIAAIKVPCDEDGDDVLFWGASKMGKFMVKSAFDIVEGHRWETEHPKWKVVWNWSGPERVKTFLWLAMSDRLLMNMERDRRHISDTTVCDHCHMGSETLLHALRDCRYAT